MGQAQINVRTRACSRTSIARTKQAALTHNVRGKELKKRNMKKQGRYKTLEWFEMIRPDREAERRYLHGPFFATHSTGRNNELRPVLWVAKMNE